MKKFSKSSKLEGVSYDVRGPVLEEADRMQEEGISILKLNTGNPAPFGFEAPNEIVRDLIMNVRESEGYSDSKGIFSARKAIEQYYQLQKFPDVTINDIYTGNGVSELITMCMQGLCNNGDEVLVPMPDYPLWTASISLAGGKPVHYICDEQADWNPDIEDIKAKVTSKTKAIVIINPNNPTGAVYEIYDRLVMDDYVHVPIATLAPDRFVVTLGGLSKSHRVAGFRVGWMVLSGDKSHVKDYIEGLNMLSSMRLCSNVLSQQIVQTALGGYQSSDELLLPGGRIYEQRAFIHKAINDIPGLSAVKPKAAFYIFPKIDIQRFNITNDEQFVLDFLHEHHILLVHGGGFNWQQPDHFRIVYLPNMEDLKTTAEKMTEFLASYRQK
jgi:alanine-synthesizing transaminase